MPSVKITIFGDICPTDDYRSLFDDNTGKALFGALMPILQGSDFVVANFECPAAKNIKKIVKCGPSLLAKPSDVQLLKNVGVDAVSLANNHIKDYGDDGVLQTLASCKSAAIEYFGAGENALLAAEPLIKHINGKSVAFLAFAEEEFNLAADNAPGANHFDPYSSLDIIEQLGENCDYVIVQYHGGIEHYKYPSPLLQKKCRKMVDMGANLVLCQHSHCIGTIENYADGTILYGQGNSIFGYRDGNTAWNEGLVVSVTIGDDVKLSFDLISAKKDGVVLASKQALNDRVNQMLLDSEKIMDKEWVKHSWDKYCAAVSAHNLPLFLGKSRVFIKLNRVFNNLLVNLFYKKHKKMITMNLMRCESHHEVIKTILENDVYGT